MNQILNKVRYFRRHLKMCQHKGYRKVMRRANAEAIKSQEQALQLLADLWPLKKDKSSNSAPSFDILEKLSAFSDEEVAEMISNLVAIELTVGCNGGCYFCCFGQKDGVTGKFSFESLQRFFEKYGSSLPDFLILYSDSDPLDFQDGSSRYSDVYKLARKFAPNVDIVTSTSVPTGSQVDLLLWVEKEIAEYLENNNVLPKIRLSLTRANVRRIETSLALLLKRLRLKSIPENEIDNIFSKIFSLDFRFHGSISSCGALINKADPLKDVFSLACVDGVIFTPEMPKSVIIVSTTKYHPSGEFRFPIGPEKLIGQVPFRLLRMAYALPLYFGQNEQEIERLLKYRISKGNVFLPGPYSGTLAEPKYYFHALQGVPPHEKASLFLSRLVCSMRLFLEFIGECLIAKIDMGLLAAYIDKAREEFPQFRKLVEDLVSIIIEIRNEEVEVPAIEKLDYFLWLTEVYLEMMQVIEASQGVHPQLISYHIRLLMDLEGKPGEKIEFAQTMIEKIREFQQAYENGKLNLKPLK